ATPDRAALPRGGDHTPQQLAHAEPSPEAPPSRPRVELHQALLERDEPAHARHRDAAARATGAVLAAGVVRRRRRPPRALVPLLPRGVAVRRDVGDPAQHPGRARPRPPAIAVTRAAHPRPRIPPCLLRRAAPDRAVHRPLTALPDAVSLSPLRRHPNLISHTSAATRSWAAVAWRTSSTLTPGATSRSTKPSGSTSIRARSVTTVRTHRTAVSG